MKTSAENTHPVLFIITGWRNTGKTTFCHFIIDGARERGLRVTGVLSPGVFEDYQKTGIEIEDLTSGERRILAHKGHDPSSEFQLPDWIFEKENLAWGNTIFKQSVPTDILIVDELGPIELEQQKGWVDAMQALDGQAYRIAFVVIRPELLQIAKQRWPYAQTITLQSVNLVPSLSAEILRGYFPAQPECL
jgi:nucleoside-triphosphatase THEP1